MGLDSRQREQIADLLTKKVRQKLAEYSRETTAMPFHTRLLGQDRMALFSFIHSINTTLGMSIFEQISTIVAAPHFADVRLHWQGLGNRVKTEAMNEVRDIMNGLLTGRTPPNKAEELQRIKSKSTAGEELVIRKDPWIVDLYLLAKDGTEHYYDLTSAKPNVKEFESLREKLLSWAALRACQDPTVEVVTALAIPYNPYAPQSYDRWTLRGLYDIECELFVAEEFWDRLAGPGTYSDLLQVFEEVGVKLRREIDDGFSQLR